MKQRGIKHLISFLWSDALGNQLGFPINPHTKELLFWEKQAVGLGCFSNNFFKKIDRIKQKEIFPDYLMTYIESLVRENGGVPISVLDVGAGPVSLLSWAHHQGLIKLTTSDILSHDYLSLLRAYKYEHAIEGIQVKSSPGEQLINHFNENERFHLVFCNNALDHMDSPAIALQQMVEVAMPKGIIVISGRSREGTNEKWDGIHMHDLYIENGKLMRTGQSDQPVDLGANLPLKTLFVEVPKDMFGGMVIFYKKLQSVH
jgi:SAM-dependent methyltransferase